MKLTLLAAAAAVIAAPAGAQGALPDVPLLAGATPAPDCGNLYGLAGKAFCVSAPLAGIGALADAYVAELEARGWLVAAGDANRVVFVKRRDGGGCDGLQMQAFYDTSRPTGPEATGYLGFGVIPGDVCAAGQPGAAPQS
jgi:hypothetical protein